MSIGERKNEKKKSNIEERKPKDAKYFKYLPTRHTLEFCNNMKMKMKEKKKKKKQTCKVLI